MQSTDDIRRFIELYDTLLIPSYQAEKDVYEHTPEFAALYDHLDALVQDYPLMRQWFIRKIMLLEERQRLARLE
jgi:hypothetical protein